MSIRRAVFKPTHLKINNKPARRQLQQQQDGKHEPNTYLRSALILLIIITSVECSLIEKWTIGIPGGLDEANRVADEQNCKNLGLVRGFSDVYLFEKRVTPMAMHRTKRALEAHPFVTWVDPQMPQERVKRGHIDVGGLMEQRARLLNRRDLLRQPSASNQQQANQFANSNQANMTNYNNSNNIKIKGVTSNSYKKVAAFDRGIYSTYSQSAGGDKRPFNDELWTHQWYLQDNANVAQLQSEIELKVEEVWRMGFTGAGVVVTILDDGLEWNHTDILPNYDARASWDMNNNRSDPFPRYDSYDSNSHGTRCAGEVAMVANNRKCGVGVAPRAKIGGIKCLDGEVADHIESMSLLHNIDHIDIYSGSWGPSDNGQVVDGPKRLASQALERGVKFGRKGKGALYIWANGNGGALGDNCNCDGYVNSIYTISIGGVTQQGQIPFYGERCSSTLAVTCSSGAYTDRKIVTTDLHNKCTIDYTGTSAAAPLAAGVYALVLEANANITWRDAQHLTAWTSNPIPIRDNPGWKRNAAGLIFNSRFGFGLLNAKAMVDAALKWQNVPKKSVCVVAPSTRMPVFLQSRSMGQVVFVSDGCQRELQAQHPPKQQHFMVNPGARLIGGSQAQPQAQAQQHQQRSVKSPVVYLEHVQVIIDLEYTSRGSLDIFLISPSGTVSTLLSRRPLDVSRNGFDKWPLMSVHFWGESSFGQWTLIVRDKDSQNNRGLLRNATLVLHGTMQRPAHMQQVRVYEGESEVGQFIDPVVELDEDDIYDLNTFPNEMSLIRDDSFQPTFIKSIIAMEQMNHHRRQTQTSTSSPEQQ